jgi:hypothetical protein
MNTKPKEVQNKEELEKLKNIQWKNDDTVYVKETHELLLYCDGYWLEYISDNFSCHT